ncbi:MAG: hypothetical protein IKP71_14250 [Candidatus Riflebacteria bacterium]|nr:hypothetical protein [Candidatus Riflebacteria bacterium]
MRNKTLTSILLVFFLTSNICCAQFVDDDPELDIDKKPLPPYSIRKVKTYEDFTNFEFHDLNGRTWTNRNGLERPMLILTGKWALRHDIKKWAHYLAFKYNNFCDIIWVFNPDSTEFANHRERNEKALKDIAIAVPVVIDNHAIIGRSLKIEYDIPTIIGLTRKNTLGFVFESPLNNYAKDRLEKLMFTKLYK